MTVLWGWNGVTCVYKTTSAGLIYPVFPKGPKAIYSNVLVRGVIFYPSPSDDSEIATKYIY